MKKIELKITPEHFQAVWDHKKKAELRKDDRGFEVGDIIVLKEWNGSMFTGSGYAVQITHILRDCPEYGLMKGYCILSFKPLGQFVDG